jgi:hypothetical protein
MKINILFLMATALKIIQKKCEQFRLTLFSF